MTTPEPQPVYLGGPRFQTEPAELYREMRRDHGAVAPVVLDGDVPAWLVLGYRELHQVTSDPQLFSRDSDLWNQWDRIPADWPLLPMIGRKQPSILYTVGERHRERAAVISEALESVDPFELKGHAERFADELIDQLCGKGACDIVGEYAMLLPLRVLARVYGFSDEQGPGLVTAMNDMINGREGALDGQRHLGESMYALLAAKAAAPGPDVASRMLANTAGFTLDEIAQDLMVMMAAGHQPTADWIGNSLRLMLTDDRFAASLAGGRHSVGEAMNEVLWEDTPTQNVAGRWTTRDTHLGGQRIGAATWSCWAWQPPTATRTYAPTRAPSPAGTTPSSPSATANTAAPSRPRRSPRPSRGPASRSSSTGSPTSTSPDPPRRSPGAPRPGCAGSPPFP